MKKALAFILVTVFFSLSGACLAHSNNCVVALKRSNGTVLKALLSKKDCKKVNALKKGESLELLNMELFKFSESSAQEDL